MSKRFPVLEHTHNESRLPFDELYRDLSDQAGDAIFVMDKEGKILYVNAAVKEIAGFLPSDYIGQHFERFVDKGSLPKAWDIFNTIVKDKTKVRDEINVIDTHGAPVPVEFTSSPIIKNGKLVQVHAIVRNITQKKLKEDIQRGAEKLKTVQHFISGTVKEIELPLKIVLDHIEVILKKYKDRGFEYVGYKEFKDILTSLDLMRGEIKECFDITHKLLLINRRRAGIKEDGCNPNLVMAEVVALFEHELKSDGIEIKTSFDKKLKTAAIGALELNQIIINIFNNAIQSIASKGTISLKTSNSTNGRFVVIECKDTGMGISKEALKHVFEPFFSTKQAEGSKSLGLGLSIVYSILRAYHGEIYIKSNLREGTTVTIQIPIKKK